MTSKDTYIRGYRKFIIALAYILSVDGMFALEVWKHGTPDLTGVAAIAAGLSSGIGFVVWGNIRENQAAAEVVP